VRIALIADSHLSPRSPECVANWHAARHAVRRLAPELTVHLGDIALDAPSHPAELAFAADLVRTWPTEMRCVPGNHDVGDGSGEEPRDDALLASYRGLFGPDRWQLAADGWRLIGINAQLLGSAGDEESAQWRWLEQVASSTAPAVRTALFVHRPVERVVPADPARCNEAAPLRAAADAVIVPSRAPHRGVTARPDHLVDPATERTDARPAPADLPDRRPVRTRCAAEVTSTERHRRNFQRRAGRGLGA
jgi:3',5'-cyclic AMP phosphodiesterase CpdA